MSNSICRSSLLRNLSSSPPANHSMIAYHMTWMTNGLSLLIFITALLGNLAALMVMLTPRHTLRITNQTYLINLAFADLLRTCCIPFTIIPRIQRNFIFGESMCRLLPVLQGLIVSIEAFTLLAICIERYLAICHPLVIMRLRSMSFSSLSNLLILKLLWILAFLTALPNFSMYHLCLMPKLEKFKCKKVSSHYIDERLYVIILDVLYFLVPMTTMVLLYSLMIKKMTEKNTAMKMKSFQKTIQSGQNSRFLLIQNQSMKCIGCKRQETILPQTSTSLEEIRQCNGRRSRGEPSNSKCLESTPDRDRRKASKVLVVLIIQFIICWTPLYIYHTIGAFNKNIYRVTPSIVLDVFLLLSFLSAACNPITYYFMSCRYREVLRIHLSRLRC